MAVLKELYKRQKLLTDLLEVFYQRLFDNRLMDFNRLLCNFCETYRRIRECVRLYDEIYGPAMIMWFSFVTLLYIAEINNFIDSLFNGKN